MAVYSAITSGQIDADSPLDTVLAGQWTNNLLAVQEGDASAPKIAHAAVDGLAWVLLETWTPTATGSHDFTFDESIYSDVRIVLENVIPATASDVLEARFGHTDGGTIVSGAAYDYEYRDIGGTAFTAVAAGDSFVTTDTVGTAAGDGLSGVIETVGAVSTLGPKGFKSFIVYRNAAGLRRTLEGSCDESMTTAFDTVQLLWTTGNFEATGTIYMYGIKKA